MFDYSWFSWKALIDLARPDVMLIIFQSLMPFSLIFFIILILLIYGITRKFIIRKTLKAKNYIIVVLLSLVIFYLLLIGFMYFIEIGLSSLSQNL